ncbi:uncharacterized protein CC84DRAFT_1238518 [Paraphaeosphaeria sporulosa]|uniref:Uncharacterized protein n=1 Tax=Paraphaeosphaeria sporulosa TaxID=1460663 RepID=A0A177BVY5_9PLEO|nr:uncharacterized protein CC84DRAFT_1238518 [Paraphaeosphaeria sporulosa]OAF98526.1 hypothetical protein CC84DRAFT_1238518 [Paraphaeosphaeria sporulosa]
MPTKLLDLSDELLSRICSHGMVHEHHQQNLPQTLQHPIARHEYLETNVVVLNLSDIRGSASRLEFGYGAAQMIMTGNPGPLLRSLVHVQLSVSVTGTQGRSLAREAEDLKRLMDSCRNLRTLHFFVQADESVLHGSAAELRQGDVVALRSPDSRDRRVAEAVVNLAKSVPLRVVTVSFCPWRRGAVVVQMVDRDTADVVDACLAGGIDQTYEGLIARVR